MRLRDERRNHSIASPAFSADPPPQAQAARPAAPAAITNAENRRRIEARFDTQFTTDQNRELWGLADAMSVDAMANWQVRRHLRMRQPLRVPQ